MGCGTDPPLLTGIDSTAMDLTVDPCQDFYRYACGGWIDKNPLPADASFIRRFDDAFYTLVPILREIIQHDAAAAPAADDPHGDLIGNYYQSCLDAPQDNGARAALTSSLQAINDIQSLDDLARQAAAQRQINSGTFFSSGISASLVDPSQRIVFIDQGGVELERYHYVDPSEAGTLAAYRSHIVALAGYFPSVSIDPDQVIAIERRLAQAALDPDDRGDPRTLSHPTAVADLSTLAPSFPWAIYFQAMGQGGIETVQLTLPDYLIALEGLLTSTPLPALKMYMAWQLIQDKVSRLDQAVLTADFDFWGIVINGLSAPQPRWWDCYYDTQRRLGMALSQPYIARHYSQSMTDEVTRMVGDLRGALSRRIAATTWLDESTRAQAQDKLALITNKIGHPDRWPTSEGLALSGTYLDDDLEIAIWTRQRDLALLAEPVDHELWATAPITVNAFYSPLDNAITIPAGILQLPFFADGYSAASNYGGIGSVMGHELTHGFDNSGRLFDGSGTLRDWWTADTAAAYGTHTQCLADQYSSYQVLPGLAVDGRLTLPENIADIGGLNVAYDALSTRGFHEGTRANLDERQQFFVAFAQLHCANTRSEFLQSENATDPHSPSSVRVNATLANVPAAAEAFSCAPGTALAPATLCSVW
jgi:putative endopeptidase